MMGASHPRPPGGAILAIAAWNPSLGQDPNFPLPSLYLIVTFRGARGHVNDRASRCIPPLARCPTEAPVMR